MIRKEILIVLVTFCLTATLFSIIPVGSQGVREYDPWYDMNDDGKIDLKDYFGVGLKYGTEGNSTKNVTVANLPLDEDGNLRTRIINDKLQVQNASVDIQILELSPGINGEVFPFSFSPKGSSVNVTKLWILLYFDWEQGSGVGAVNVTLNDIATKQVTDPLYGRGEGVVSIPISDPLFTTAIRCNHTNTIRVSIGNRWAYCYFRQYKITLSIEYQCLA